MLHVVCESSLPSDINFFQFLYNSADLSDHFSDKTQHKIILMFSFLKGMVMLLLVLGETLLMKGAYCSQSEGKEVISLLKMLHRFAIIWQITSVQKEKLNGNSSMLEAWEMSKTHVAIAYNSVFYQRLDSLYQLQPWSL